jgi:hypothetical protein
LIIAFFGFEELSDQMKNGVSVHGGRGGGGHKVVSLHVTNVHLNL